MPSVHVEEIEIVDGRQRWRISWHAPGEVPAGRPHGSAGICMPDDGGVVLVSRDGLSWDFPAGRPEKDESWEDTLRREMREEACVVVQEPRLLGFSRGRCIEGPEQGLVLVRAIWQTKVQLLAWKPEFEMSHRKIVATDQAILLTPRVSPDLAKSVCGGTSFRDVSVESKGRTRFSRDSNY